MVVFYCTVSLQGLPEHQRTEALVAGENQFPALQISEHGRLFVVIHCSAHISCPSLSLGSHQLQIPKHFPVSLHQPPLLPHKHQPPDPPSSRVQQGLDSLPFYPCTEPLPSFSQYLPCSPSCPVRPLGSPCILPPVPTCLDLGDLAFLTAPKASPPRKHRLAFPTQVPRSSVSFILSSRTICS